MSQGKTAILFKSEKDGHGKDPYVEALERLGVVADCIPVLGFTYVNASTLWDALRKPQDHSGVILTSPRSVEAIRNVCQTHSGTDGWESSWSPWWRRLPAYVVGQATASEAEKLGLTPIGQESGNAANLVQLILEDRQNRGGTSLPLLFPCGNLRKETIPGTLQSKGIPLRSLTVYETSADPDIHPHLERHLERLQGAQQRGAHQMTFPDYLVYFSPSGVDYTYGVLRDLQFPMDKIKTVVPAPCHSAPWVAFPPPWQHQSKMEPVVYIAAAAVVILVLVVISLLNRSTPTGEPAGDVAAPGPAREAVVVRGGRRGGPRQRPQRRQDPDEDEEDYEDQPDIDLPEGKVGAKKMKKLQDKAEKRAARESELQDREERKQREELREEQRKKDDAKREAEEAVLAEEEKARKEEEEKREHEEYLKLKEAFTVDEEGTHEKELNVDTESLLEQFISHIKEMKVVMLEDLAAHFKIKTQDAIERVTTLIEEGVLTGVLDDRGKFIYITQDEYEAVAKFIKQRGRVSITELAECSNQLINLQADQEIMHKKMVTEEVEASAS